MTNTNQNCSNTREFLPPLYVTIGPPCAGKTTLLQSHQLNLKNLDIALDDQEGVYLPIPTQRWLQPTYVSLTSPSQQTQQRQQLQQHQQQQDDEWNTNTKRPRKQREPKVYGKTITQRLEEVEQQELRTIVQRFSGYITKGEFEAKITAFYQSYHEQQQQQQQQQQPNTQETKTTTYLQIAQDLVAVVEETITSSPQTPVPLPTTIDLFCVEALFRPDPNNQNLTAIDVAHAALDRAAHNQTPSTVSWGNTNTRPREYKAALQIAESSRRPVHFCLYQGGASDTLMHSSSDDTIFWKMPALPFRELLHRNVNRLLTTGKFVPARAVWESSQRIANLWTMVGRELNRTNGSDDDDDDGGDLPVYTTLQIEQVLAKLANYEMSDNRRVRFVPPKKNQRNGSNYQRTQQRRRPSNGSSTRYYNGSSKSDNERPQRRNDNYGNSSLSGPIRRYNTFNNGNYTANSHSNNNNNINGTGGYARQKRRNDDWKYRSRRGQPYGDGRRPRRYHDGENLGSERRFRARRDIGRPG